MFTKKQIKDELEANLALKTLTEIYEDIAVVGMQNIRQKVLTNRIFLEGVSSLYSLAKAAFIKQLVSIKDKHLRDKETDFLKRNGKTIAVFISGNHTFLGNIIIQTYRTYMDVISKIDCDYAVMGKIGSYLLKDAKLPKPFADFPLDDYELSDPKVKLALQFIARYQKIIIVYPKFITLLSQEPQVEDISGGIVIDEKKSKKAKSYFFEPSPKEVIAYFEGEIIEALFRQKLLEAILARYGSRLTMMDSASKKIGKIIEENRKINRKIERNDDNRKLFGYFAGISLWEEQVW